ncbi:MAG: hypothetical protein MJZ66_05750 [Bacteroidales bacterium]|nr:hypothetical protein [Bacteroidales bacterium]
MYKMSHKIMIDGKELPLLESVTIKESVESLIKTAEIKLPYMRYNKPISRLDSIARGKKVSVNIGYNDELKEEFLGYVSNVYADRNGMVINCEDEMYKFRITDLKNEVLKNPSVEDILKKVIKQVNPNLKLECDYSFKYDKFTIQTATALDVLKQIQDESHCGIYVIGGTLHVHPVYTDNFGTVKYDMAKNIDRDGFSLKYKNKEDRKLKVTAKGKNKDGKQIEKYAGEGGGDTETIDYKGITTEADLQKMADEIYKRKSYTGYEGSFQAWLIPECHRGYRAELSDETDTIKNGTYFVKSVETSYSRQGGIRKVELGKKL